MHISPQRGGGSISAGSGSEDKDKAVAATIARSTANPASSTPPTARATPPHPVLRRRPSTGKILPVPTSAAAQAAVTAATTRAFQRPTSIMLSDVSRDVRAREVRIFSVVSCG